MAKQLSTLDDVKSVLRLTDSDRDRDSQLQRTLDAEEAWFLQRCRGEFHVEGTPTARFYEVTNDAVVHLPVPNSTVVEVRVGSPGFLRVLATNEYIVMDTERIRLRSGFYWPYGQYDDLQSHVTETVEVVEVDYTPPTNIDPAVTRGIALLAAASWLHSNPNLHLTEEKIGDYMYRTVGAVQGEGPLALAEKIRADGMRMLRPWMRRRVLVT